MAKNISPALGCFAVALVLTAAGCGREEPAKPPPAPAPQVEQPSDSGKPPVVKGLKPKPGS